MGGPQFMTLHIWLWKGPSTTQRVQGFQRASWRIKLCNVWYNMRKQTQLAVLSCSWFLLTLSISGVMLTGVALQHGSLYCSWETRCRVVWGYGKETCTHVLDQIRRNVQSHRAFIQLFTGAARGHHMDPRLSFFLPKCFEFHLWLLFFQLYHVFNPIRNNKQSFLRIHFFIALKQHLSNYHFILKKNHTALFSLERRLTPFVCLQLSGKRSPCKETLNLKVSFPANFQHWKASPLS